MLYRVHINIEDLQPELLEAGVDMYETSGMVLKVFMAGEDPDDVCHKAVKKLIADVTAYRRTSRVLELAKDINNLIRVVKLEISYPFP
jgi:hypothetical protein